MASSRSSSKFRPLAGVRPRPRRGRPGPGRRRRRRVARQVYHAAHGWRSLRPGSDDLTTIFDLASPTQGHGDGPVLVEHATRGAFRSTPWSATSRRWPAARRAAPRSTGLTHTAGFVPDNPLPDYAGESARSSRRSRGAACCAPGSRFTYSDVGYALARRVAERRRGGGWTSWRTSALFQPLRFRDTRSARGGRTAAASRRPSEPTGAAWALSTIRARGRGRSRESAGMRGCSGRRARWRASAR